ncbi:MAG TPA: acriflavin resistance protein [Micromonosporaceae bacterium]|nr:acriflavin resistance protein [Micromonosporaceae bacterium]HCU48389.1 acriflavin resistance protein [Micromonosporaceae bacterium]
MRWIVGTSLKFRALVLALAIGMMIVGVGHLRDTPVDVFPEFAPPKVEVQTSCLGLSSAEVEELVTVPQEQALQGIPDLDELRSRSVPQLAQIELIFAPGTELLQARQLTQERVASVAAALPSWCTPPVLIQPLSATSRIMKIGISSPDRSLVELSMISFYTIRARLLQISGVANVAIWGQRKQMLNVQLDPELMSRHNVTLDRVKQITADALDAGLLTYADGAIVGTGGFTETPNQRLAVEHVARIATPADLAKVLIDERNGSPVTLGDVARVVEDYPPLIGDAVINSGPGLMLVVEKLPWGNTLEVTRDVEEALADLAPGLSGVDIDTTIFRPATFIEHALSNLQLALLLGCLLVLLVLGAFLYSWRTAVISLAAIPLSLMAAWLVLSSQGAVVNTMILAGFVIAIGVVVDDAIIDIENIVRRIRQHRREGSTKPIASIILEASLEVRAPIIYATLIILVAAAPIFFLTGLTGAFFQPLALAYGLAVLASLVVALTVTPALALVLLRKADLNHREPPLTRWLQARYQAALGRIVHRPLWAYLAVLVIALAGIGAVPFLGQSLLPNFKERDFLMHWVTEPSTSHPEMVRITEAASRELKALPGVRNFGAHIGQAVNADEPVGINFTENWISVDEKADYDRTLASVQEVVDGYPGLRRDVQTYLKERIREVLSGAGEAIVVRLYGNDLEVLRAKAAEVKQILGDTRGVVDEHVSLQVNVPQIDVRVNLEAAQRYGLKPGDVRRAVAAMVATEEVGDLYRGGRIYDVRLWSTPETRHDLTALRNIPIDTPDGGHVRLQEVAEVAIKPTPNIITHDRGFRKLDVGANVRDRDLGSTVDEITNKLARVEFPQGYHFELLGEYAERQEAERRLIYLAIAVVVAIMVLLQMAFGNWRLTGIVLVTLPSALVGGVLAASVGGGVISLGSLVGFFTVLGIAARNGILMIGHFQHLERLEGVPFGPELVLRGARERLAPILMTTLAAGLALVPMVLLGQIPGNEIEHPMAIVILGGLATSTLLNLFVIPAVYLRFGGLHRQRHSLRAYAANASS